MPPDKLRIRPLSARLQAFEVPQERGSDDAVVQTVADQRQARLSDGRIGIAFEPASCWQPRADHGPKHAPGVISDEGSGENRTAQKELRQKPYSSG